VENSAALAATPVPGFIANQCPDDTGSLVGGSVLYDIDQTKVSGGQLGWAIGALEATAVNDFVAPMDNPSNDPDLQTWGWEKVIAEPTWSFSGTQSWRLTRGLLDSGTLLVLVFACLKPHPVDTICCQRHLCV
jgi:hypothetical protein